jgi:hypothetical protein
MESRFGALVARLRQLEDELSDATCARESETTRLRIHTEDLVKSAQKIAVDDVPLAEQAAQLARKLAEQEEASKALRVIRSVPRLADTLRSEASVASASRNAEEVWAAKASRANARFAQESEEVKRAVAAEQRATAQALAARAELASEQATVKTAVRERADARERAQSEQLRCDEATVAEEALRARIAKAESGAQAAESKLASVKGERDAALVAIQEAGKRAQVESEAERARLAAESEKWMQAEAAMCARLEYAEDRLEAVLRSGGRCALSAGELGASCPWPLQSWPKGDREKERRWARNHIRRVATPEWRF